jgi:hypothetical protein
MTWMRRALVALAAVAALGVAVSAEEKVKKRSAADYAEIQQLYVQYARSIDTKGDKGMDYARTFTDDGELSGPGRCRRCSNPPRPDHLPVRRHLHQGSPVLDIRRVPRPVASCVCGGGSCVVLLLVSSLLTPQRR